MSVIAPDYKQQGQTVVPAELQYVEIISVTASSGYDANTGEPVDEADDKELPDTVKRALDDLCRAGLLQKDPRWRENGSLTSNLYHVV